MTKLQANNRNIQPRAKQRVFVGIDGRGGFEGTITKDGTTHVFVVSDKAYLPHGEWFPRNSKAVKITML